MKTPNLLDVPKTAPSRKEKLEAFKKQHGIETHYAPGLGWLAMHLPSARKFGYGITEESTMFDCEMKVGRLLMEAGVTDTGETEREAVRMVCTNLDIPCPL